MVSIVNNNFLNQDNFKQAWLKVKENKGCAGVDRQTIDDFAQNQEFNLTQLREVVANSKYHPYPCKQVLIPTNKGKKRKLRIPTVRDRIVQQALLNVLIPIAEANFSPCSFAYRPNISYIQAVEKVAYWRDLGYNWVLDADIVNYFDSIDHQILLYKLREYIDHPGILCLIKAWISSGILSNHGQELSEQGIPQGAVISPLLANIYLDGFDRHITKKEYQLVRYADDFLVLADSQAKILQAYTEVVNLLDTIKLTIHPEKTQITNFEHGFCFLGHGFLDSAIFPVDKLKHKKKQEQKKTIKQRGTLSRNKKKVQTRKNYKEKRKNRYHNY